MVADRDDAGASNRARTTVNATATAPILLCSRAIK